MSKTPVWQRLVSPVSVVASGFTALCCLGISAAVSLATSVGATFMTSDSTLRPLLIVFLAITVIASAFSFRRHRLPWPLVITVLAAVGVYVSIFNPFAGHGTEAATGAHGDDHMGDDHMGDEAAMHGGAAGAEHGGGHAAFSTPHLLLVAVIFAVLIAAQVWDFLKLRRASRSALPAE
jgi:MerC mercury resistance protein